MKTKKLKKIAKELTKASAMHKRQSKAIKTLYNMGGYKTRYNAGGLKQMYQGGGMYSDNTAASVGQGNNSTANIVYQESDPNLQNQRVQGLKAEQSRLQSEGVSTSSDVESKLEQGRMQGDVDAANAAMEVEGKMALGKSALSGAQTLAEGFGVEGKGVNAFSAAKNAYQGAKLAQAATAGQNITQAGILGAEGSKLAATAAKGGGQMMSSAITGKTIVVDGAGNVVKAGQAVGKGSAVLKGAGAFLKSGAGLGLVASGLGVGTAVGAVLGGIVGGVSKFFGSNKARRAKRKAEREQKRKVAKIINKSNKSLVKNYSSQKSAVRAGEMAQKTYSGYDMGRNVTAQMGGMRMGMPRYGIAS